MALFDRATGRVVAETLHSQIALHAPYGGVVPELASRDHIRYGLRLTDQALRQAGVTGRDVQTIAYTQGPGLAGALLVGAQLAASLPAWGKPVIPVHHMEGICCRRCWPIRRPRSRSSRCWSPAGTPS